MKKTAHFQKFQRFYCQSAGRWQLLTVWTRLKIFSDSATEGKTFSFSNFLILTTLSGLVNRRQSMQRFENNCFSRGENCTPFCFCVYLPISALTHLGIVIFFQAKRSPQPPPNKSECARMPMYTGMVLQFMLELNLSWLKSIIIFCSGTSF